MDSYLTYFVFYPFRPYVFLYLYLFVLYAYLNRDHSLFHDHLLNNLWYDLLSNPSHVLYYFFQVSCLHVRYYLLFLSFLQFLLKQLEKHVLESVPKKVIFQACEFDMGHNGIITSRCFCIFCCIGTGMRGNSVENHSSFINHCLSISPILIIWPPPALTSISYNGCKGMVKKIV